MMSRCKRNRRHAVTAFALFAVAIASIAAGADDPAPKSAEARPGTRPAPGLGLQLNDPGAFQGYTLVAPLNSTKTRLIDMEGRVVHTWESKYTAGQDAYLLENGHLLRAATLNDSERHFATAGQGGRVQEFDWDGNLVWDFKFHDDKRVAHHAICRLPNGNVLLIVWEIKTADEAIAAGRRPDKVPDAWLADSVVEIKPTGKTSGDVVWEWHAWDHLVQDVDASKANFGDVAANPQLIDLNFGDSDFGLPGGLMRGGPPRPSSRDAAVPGTSKARDERDAGVDRLRGIGYVGGASARGNRGFVPDWTHVNSVAYNAEHDQIVICVRAFGEFWIIDHGTTTAEAASHSGGRRGHGGDLLYRWGNPRSYRAGPAADQRLFTQHDAHWIPKGYPGDGHILVFNNGNGRPGGNYSSVDEIVLPVNERGDYVRTPGKAFEPREPAKSYSAPKKADLFSFIMSGANRLPNGNTLICESVSGTILEVNPEGKTVWKYINPDSGSAPTGMPTRPPTLADVLPPMLQFRLNLSAEQRAKLDTIQKGVLAKLETILDEPRKKQLLERRAADPMGFGGMASAGQILPISTQVVLKLSAEQREAIATLQKVVDAKIESLLDDTQKSLLKQTRENAGQVRRPGAPAPDRGAGFAGPGGPRGPGGPPPARRGGFGRSSVFRAYRYANDYPGLANKELTPLKVEGNPSRASDPN
jgi:Arylsulfotransferase (ASST)